MANVRPEHGRCFHHNSGGTMRTVTTGRPRSQITNALPTCGEAHGEKVGEAPRGLRGHTGRRCGAEGDSSTPASTARTAVPSDCDTNARPLLLKPTSHTVQQPWSPHRPGLPGKRAARAPGVRTSAPCPPQADRPLLALRVPPTQEAGPGLAETGSSCVRYAAGLCRSSICHTQVFYSVLFRRTETLN